MSKAKYDNAALLWKIDRQYKSRADFCKAAGIELRNFRVEIRGGEWRAETITKAVKVLDIPRQEIGFYFYAPIAHEV